MNWILEYSPIFFDFDGLLVDTEPFHYKAYRTLLKNHGISCPWDFPTYITLAHKSSVGLRNATTELAPQLLKSHLWEELYEEKKAIYDKLIEKSPLELMPGAEKMLEIVQSANIPHAVVTNSTFKQISLIQEHLPLLKKIPHWITREDYQSPKPAPDAYLKAIEVLGTSDHMLGFEDSLKGIHALEEASITPVLICPSDHPQVEKIPKGSLRIYSSFKNLFHDII
jgi:beta-phosphoglucomutase